jgi:capsular exopolysaccharide synthesis family protein
MKNNHQNPDHQPADPADLIAPEVRGPMYHRPHYGTPTYYGAAAYGGEPGSEDEEGIDLLKLVRILLRRWYTVLIFLIIGGLSAFLYINTATPIYKAEAELEMSVRRPKVIESQAVYDDASSVRDTDIIINTRFAKFRSPTMEEMAIAEYFKRVPEGPLKAEKIQDILRENVTWSKDRKANIVRVTAEYDDPKVAAQLVNVLTYCAGTLMIQENQDQSDGAVQWLRDQVEEQRASLDKVEQQLSNLRKEVQLDSLQQRKSALGEALNEVAAERSQVQSRLESRKAIYEFVVELNETQQDLAKLPTGLPKEAELNRLMTDWREAQYNLEQVEDIYTKEHPERMRLAKEEERARERVDEFITIAGESVKNEIRLLERQLAQLDRRVEQMEAQSVQLEMSVVSGEQKLQSLERRREAADDAYSAVLKRMEEARLSADENTAFIKIIRNAEIPKDPIRPRKLIILALGLMVGTGLGTIMAFLMEFWTDKIVLVSDLRELGLNIIGTIPTQKKVESRGDLATIGLKDKFSHVFEIFCGINTLLSSRRYQEQTHVMLVCSVMPGEGKTISACNLAISSAMNDTKTLLIDGDLRRPRLANVFEISEEHPSLLEWLSSTDEALDLEHLVNSDVHANLDVITSRPSRQTNPAELMGRARLTELIDWARKNYDRVIIDSPPIGLVGDTQALANQADSVVVVSRLKQTRKRSLKFALGRLTELDATVVGCIANDVPHSLAGMFQGGGDYSYGYGGNGSYKPYGHDEG